MEKEFVPYEQALALKELGFDEPCLGYYVGKDKEVYTSNETLSAPFKFRLESKTTFVAPLYQQAFRWFREKYKLHTWIYQVEDSKFFFSCLKNGRYLVCNSIEFTTYEEAEQECLVKLIEIVKNK
jgi:hypothetical protein